MFGNYARLLAVAILVAVPLATPAPAQIFKSQPQPQQQQARPDNRPFLMRLFGLGQPEERLFEARGQSGGIAQGTPPHLVAEPGDALGRRGHVGQYSVFSVQYSVVAHAAGV